MINFELPLSTIRAILPTIPKKEARFYLVGALFDLDAGRIVATDGHRMIVCDGPRIADGGRHIVPRDALATIAKSKSDIITLSFSDRASDGTATFQIKAGTTTLSGVTVDGHFPEYHRVIPRQFTHEIAQYNAEYMADAQNALATFFGMNMTKTFARVEYNGHAPGIMHVNKPGCFVVIMPQRTDDRMDRDMAAFIGCVTDAPTAAAA